MKKTLIFKALLTASLWTACAAKLSAPPAPAKTLVRATDPVLDALDFQGSLSGNNYKLAEMTFSRWMLNATTRGFNTRPKGE